jgi:hypothetical protein
MCSIMFIIMLLEGLEILVQFILQYVCSNHCSAEIAKKHRSAIYQLCLFLRYPFSCYISICIWMLFQLIFVLLQNLFLSQLIKYIFAVCAVFVIISKSLL